MVPTTPTLAVTAVCTAAALVEVALRQPLQHLAGRVLLSSDTTQQTAAISL
jgi:hypothetical protein